MRKDTGFFGEDNSELKYMYSSSFLFSFNQKMVLGRCFLKLQELQDVFGLCKKKKITKLDFGKN